MLTLNASIFALFQLIIISVTIHDKLQVGFRWMHMQVFGASNVCMSLTNERARRAIIALAIC
jgi:hypothetical protein